MRMHSTVTKTPIKDKDKDNILGVNLWGPSKWPIYNSHRADRPVYRSSSSSSICALRPRPNISPVRSCNSKCTRGPRPKSSISRCRSYSSNTP